MKKLYPMEDLFDLLHQIHPLGDNFKTLLPLNMLPMEGPLNENSVRLRQGDISNIAYWMPVGYARAYRMLPGEFPGELKQQTINFWRGGDLVIIKDSLFKQVPSTHFLEFSRDAVLKGITYANMQLMREQTTETNELIFKILSDDYAELIDRVALLKLPCGMRYKCFLDHFHPRIEQYYELRSIASYLAMDPTTLSGLRA